MKKPQVIAAVGSGLVYGVLLRLLLHIPGSDSVWVRWLRGTDEWVMTLGFLLVGPFALGWITASAAQKDQCSDWKAWIFTPWLAVLLSDACFLLAGIEGMICIVMAVPITLVVSSLGGIAGGQVARSRFEKKGVTTLCLAMLPLLLAGVENQQQAPVQTRTVETSIVIHAPEARIWQNVERVRPIAHDELQPTWTHRVGFPLPIEATLDHERVGGVRHASFEHGLMFVETVTHWEPGHLLTFAIKAATSSIPPTTLDEHVTIGGRYFDVLDGEYELEPLASGDTLLHLRSHERLSTDFNWYAGLWTDAIMRSLQESILAVEKHRCEAEAER